MGWNELERVENKVGGGENWIKERIKEGTSEMDEKFVKMKEWRKGRRKEGWKWFRLKQKREKGIKRKKLDKTR